MRVSARVAQTPALNGRAAAAASLLIAGGGAAAVVAGIHVHGYLVVILIGVSLTIAGGLSPAERWLMGVGLPILGFGLGVELSTIVPPLAGYLTTGAFVGTGGALMLGEGLKTPAWAAIAGIFFIDAGLGAATVAIGAWHPWQSSGWLFGVAEVVASLSLLARAWGAVGTAPAEAVVPAAQASLRAQPRAPAVQALALFAGAVGVAVVDELTGNLYQVVFALGLAYLIAGVVARHRGWRQSGALIAALGAAITLTDFVPEAVSFIDVLVFTAILLAALGLLVFAGGSVGGLGRSLVVIGLVLAVLAAPASGPFDLVRSHLDVLLPLGPAASALAIGLRWAIRRVAERT